MPSVSKKQQKFMGIVRAIQKGDQPAGKFSKDARDAAKKMKKKDVKKFAKTKHDGLPTKVRQEIEEYVDGIIDGIGEQFMVNEEKECMCEACQKGYMTHPTRKTKVMFGKRYRNCIKKESTKAYADTLNKIANDKKMKMISKKDKALLTKIAKLMKKQKPIKLRSKSGMGTISHFGMPETVDEGKYSKIMKAVRKGPKSGPWQIIVSKNNKVVKEVPVRTLQLIPAHYDDIKKAYPNHKIGIEAKDGKIVYREWVVNIKEGTCGYGIDGNLGEEPAGPHLLKKKKKKKDEVSLGGRMAKKVGKHKGSRNILSKADGIKKVDKMKKTSGAKIYKVDKVKTRLGGELITMYNLYTKNTNHSSMSNPYGLEMMRKGNKAAYLIPVKESVNEGLNSSGYSQLSRSIKALSINIKDLAKAHKKQDDSALRNEIDNIMFDVKRMVKIIDNKKYNESINEGGMELKKLEYAIKMFQKKIEKQGRVTNARDEDHLKNLIKIYKQMGGKKIKESVNERMDKRQAGEMLKQLGGNKFIAMTGAKNFVVGPKGASFKIGRNSKNVNYVRIDLKNDLYDMEFIQMRAGKMKVKSKVKQIYADQLQQMFTKHTGMYTSL